MKQLLATACAAAIVLSGAAFAAPVNGQDGFTVATSDTGVSIINELDRKGRKKKRVPGGSGCDDPGDIIEHPECAG